MSASIFSDSGPVFTIVTLGDVALPAVKFVRSCSCVCWRLAASVRSTCVPNPNLSCVHPCQMNSSLETGFLRTRTRPRLEVETSNVYVMFLSGEVLYEGVNPAVSCDVDSFVCPSGDHTTYLRAPWYSDSLGDKVRMNQRPGAKVWLSKDRYPGHEASI